MNAYLGTYQVVSLLDLEIELITFLKTFNLTTLDDQTETLYKDANEIDLNEEINTYGISTSCDKFSDYGLGQLQSHPILKRFFPSEIVQKISLSEYYNILSQYSHNTSDFNHLEISNFAFYLASKHNVECINQLGLIILGDLKEDLLMLRHVKSSRNISIEKNHSTNTNSSHIDGNDSPEPFNYKVRMNAPSEEVSMLLEVCKKITTGKGKPNKARILTAIDDFFTNDETAANKKKVIFESVAEYLLLYLGSSKYRKKVIKVETFDNLSSDNEGFKLGRIPTTSTSLNNMGFDVFNSFEKNDKDVKVEKYKSCGTESLNIINGSTNYKVKVDLDQYKFLFPNPLSKIDFNNNYSIGRYGEAIVYQYLMYTQPNKQITWLNSDSESNAYYDIKIFSEFETLKSTRFIEVKTTILSKKHIFQISPWEYEFIVQHPRPNYDIYRVYLNLDIGIAPHFVMYQDIYKLLLEKKLNLYIGSVSNC